MRTLVELLYYCEEPEPVGAIPVSYIHLDVYKRQLLWFFAAIPVDITQTAGFSVTLVPIWCCWFRFIPVSYTHLSIVLIMEAYIYVNMKKQRVIK